MIVATSSAFTSRSDAFVTWAFPATPAATRESIVLRAMETPTETAMAPPIGAKDAAPLTAAARASAEIVAVLEAAIETTSPAATVPPETVAAMSVKIELRASEPAPAAAPAAKPATARAADAALTLAVMAATSVAVSDTSSAAVSCEPVTEAFTSARAPLVPIVFVASEAPIAAAPAARPAPERAAAPESITASIVPANDAATFTSAALVTVLPEIVAFTLGWIVLFASAPAPLSEMLPNPAPLAETAAAIAVALIVAFDAAETCTSPVFVETSAAFLMPLVTTVLIVFFARPTPIDTAPPTTPDSDAASDAAPVQVVMVEESWALSAMLAARMPAVPLPSILASMATPTVLTLLAPAPLAATPITPAAAIAAEPATTTESIVCPPTASSEIAPEEWTLVAARLARTAPPITFAASAAPIEAPTAAAPPAAAADVANTSALIAESLRASISTSPTRLAAVPSRLLAA